MGSGACSLAYKETRVSRASRTVLLASLPSGGVIFFSASLFIAARVGHSSASFTYDTYAKSIPAADRNASSIVENALAKLIETERVSGTRTGREVREKDAKSRELHEQENSLRPYNPINIGLHGHDEQDLWGGRGVSNPEPNSPEPNE